MRIEIVLGPPGTGKTTTLLNCVDEELSRGTPPNRIAYVSFTKRAAEEAITRAVKKFKLPREAFPYFCTLHSLCYKAHGLEKSRVMDGPKTQKDFAEYAGITISGKWSEDGSFSGYEVGDRIMHIISMSHVRCSSLRDEYNLDPGMNWNLVERVNKCYEAYKSEHYLMDFNDMLEEYYRQELSPPDDLKVLVVDEAQDLSVLQWRVVAQLAVGCERVIVAGDDDQAIYQWAGANVDGLLQMTGDVRVLNQSYRVPRKVQAVAHELSRKIRNRRPKEWKARDAEGIVERRQELDDVDFSGNDVLVLVRNEFLMSRVHSLLKREGIVYSYGRFHTSSIKERYLEAAEYWTHLVRGDPVEIAAVRRVYSLMTVGIGVKRGFKTMPGREDDELVTFDQLKKDGGLLLEKDVPWHTALDGIPKADVSYMQAARKRGVKLRQKPSVRLSTIHTAKGAEAEHVVVLLEMARRSRREADLNPDDELRVWYVAVTRAKEKLTLVRSSTNLECPWL